MHISLLMCSAKKHNFAKDVSAGCESSKSYLLLNENR